MTVSRLEDLLYGGKARCEKVFLTTPMPSLDYAQIKDTSNGNGIYPTNAGDDIGLLPHLLHPEQYCSRRYTCLEVGSMVTLAVATSPLLSKGWNKWPDSGCIFNEGTAK